MAKPPFKVIAVDMDGTFLDDQKQFNRELFEKLLDRCRELGVRFVVATGDPLDLIQHYFKDYADEVTIVSENGAQITQQQEPLLLKTMDPGLVARLLIYLVDEMGLSPVLSGSKGGYFRQDSDKVVINTLRRYYLKYALVDSWLPLPADKFFQVSFLLADEEVPQAAAELRKHFGDVLDITPSGNGSMDITQPGITKGWALQQLLDQWEMKPEDLAAFGDGGNDVSMLQLAGHSFAMPNGGQAAKAAADQVAIADNNHDGVLKTLLELLA